LFNESNDSFEPWDGLVSRTTLWDEESEIAATIYVCKTYESALVAKERVHKLREMYDPYVGFTTELLGEVKGHHTIE
jgi:hypothetical protein